MKVNEILELEELDANDQLDEGLPGALIKIIKKILGKNAPKQRIEPKLGDGNMDPPLGKLEPGEIKNPNEPTLGSGSAPKVDPKEPTQGVDKGAPVNDRIQPIVKEPETSYIDQYRNTPKLGAATPTKGDSTSRLIIKALADKHK